MTQIQKSPAPVSAGDEARDSSTLNLNYNSGAAAAQELIEQGVPVFPVDLSAPDTNGKRAKTPKTPRGHNDATVDESTIVRWWKRWPEAVPGVPTGPISGMWALDIDPDGEAWAEEHAGLLMAAGRVNHTERGKHYLFTHADGVRNSAGKITQGVDVRGDGGWIVWWPARGLETIGGIDDIAPAPEALVGLATGPQKRREPAGAVQAPQGGESIIEGNRNDTLARQAGRMRRDGMTEKVINAALQQLNTDLCSPPLDADEVAGIANSISRYDPAQTVAGNKSPAVANNDDQRSNSLDLAAAGVGDLIGTPPPVRRWLVNERLPLDIVALLAAAGGTGKSMATLQLAVSVATGWPWLDQEMGEPGTVMMLSAEDDRDEIHRRLARVLELYADDADPFATDDFADYHAQVAERLFIFDRVGDDNRLTAKVDRETIPTGFADRVVETAEEMPEPPKLIVLDPLARFDGGDPNDNSDGTRLIEAAERIRKATGATVLLPHHVAKGSLRDSQAGQEAVRGASGLVDGARWVGMLASMKPDQAKEYGIDREDAGQYVQLTTPKANYSAPWPGLWLKRRAGGALIPTSLTPQKQAAKERQSEAAYAETLPRILHKVREAAQNGEPITRRRLREYAGAGGIFGVGDQSLRAMIERAVDEGHLREHASQQGTRGGKVLKTW